MIESVHNPKRKVIAVFDFDGTISHRDTLFPFIIFVVGWRRFILGLIVLSPIFVAYMAKFLSNQNAKGIVLKYYFGNMHVKCLENMSKKFIKSPNLPKLRAKALEAILWHQKKAHDIIILSASLEIYLIPWSKMLGIDKVAGTKLRLRNNIITGHIDGRNCYGEEKVVRLKNLYGNLNEYELYGYGDTVGDRAFLNICDHSFYKKWPDR